MWALIGWSLLAVLSVHLCSWLETVLFSARIPMLLDYSGRGYAGAQRLLEIRRSRMEDAISAVLIVNTIASTVGTTLAGAWAIRLFGSVWLSFFSAVLTLVLLVVSEIIPKTLASSYAGTASNVTGYVLFGLIRGMWPALIVTRTIVRLFALHRRDRVTRREFATLVRAAPSEGALSVAEASLIGSMIHSRDVAVCDVMTPLAMVVMWSIHDGIGQVVDDRAGEAFSRWPVYGSSRRDVRGYVAQRDVLRALAAGAPRTRRMETLLRRLPVLPPDMAIGRAIEELLATHEAIALVVTPAVGAVGLAALEDLLEALLGMDITDEAASTESLRPAIESARRVRRDRLKAERAHLPAADA